MVAPFGGGSSGSGAANPEPDGAARSCPPGRRSSTACRRRIRRRVPRPACASPPRHRPGTAAAGNGRASERRGPSRGARRGGPHRGRIGQHRLLRLLVEALGPVESDVGQGAADLAQVVHHVPAADRQDAVLPQRRQASVYRFPSRAFIGSPWPMNAAGMTVMQFPCRRRRTRSWTGHRRSAPPATPHRRPATRSRSDCLSSGGRRGQEVHVVPPGTR
jgi:hypothetical protein